MILCDFRRVITISDKIDVGPWKILNKQCDQCIDINQTYHEYQWADICVTVLASQRTSNSIVGVLFTTFSDFLKLLKLYITRCHYEIC